MQCRWLSQLRSHDSHLQIHGEPQMHSSASPLSGRLLHSSHCRHPPIRLPCRRIRPAHAADRLLLPSPLPRESLPPGPWPVLPAPVSLPAPVLLLPPPSALPQVSLPVPAAVPARSQSPAPSSQAPGQAPPLRALPPRAVLPPAPPVLPLLPALSPRRLRCTSHPRPSPLRYDPKTRTGRWTRPAPPPELTQDLF